jgi:hypothetical protein
MVSCPGTQVNKAAPRSENGAPDSPATLSAPVLMGVFGLSLVRERPKTCLATVDLAGWNLFENNLHRRERILCAHATLHFLEFSS